MRYFVVVSWEISFKRFQYDNPSHGIKFIFTQVWAFFSSIRVSDMLHKNYEIISTFFLPLLPLMRCYTGLHQERAYTYSGISGHECLQQSFVCLFFFLFFFCLYILVSAFRSNCNLQTKCIIHVHVCMSKQQKNWCMHSAQEIPK